MKKIIFILFFGLVFLYFGVDAQIKDLDGNIISNEKSTNRTNTSNDDESVDELKELKNSLNFDLYRLLMRGIIALEYERFIKNRFAVIGAIGIAPRKDIFSAFSVSDFGNNSIGSIYQYHGDNKAATSLYYHFGARYFVDMDGDVNRLILGLTHEKCVRNFNHSETLLNINGLSTGYFKTSQSTNYLQVGIRREVIDGRAAIEGIGNLGSTNTRFNDFEHTPNYDAIQKTNNEINQKAIYIGLTFSLCFQF